ncbi:MAG: PAS domain-containing protein, partial [Phycisphaeraceae bacterium]
MALAEHLLALAGGLDALLEPGDRLAGEFQLRLGHGLLGREDVDLRLELVGVGGERLGLAGQLGRLVLEVVLLVSLGEERLVAKLLGLGYQVAGLVAKLVALLGELVDPALQRLDLALEVTDTGVWVWDMETDEEIWDETMKRLFGIESESFEGTFDGFIEQVHPEDRERVENTIQTAIEEDLRFEAEYRIQRDEGEQIWVLARGEVVTEKKSNHMMGVVTDITDRKKREREVESLKERYETLLNAAPDPVFVADAETGAITEVNEAAERLLGESRGDI